MCINSLRILTCFLLQLAPLVVITVSEPPDCSDGDETCAAKPLARSDVSEKLNVWVGFQSKCPECTAFLNGTLAPVWQMLDVRAVLDLHLNVYGNTREYPISEVPDEEIAAHTNFHMSAEAGFKKLHVCHHGPGECAGNLIEACARNYLPNKQFVDLVLCVAATMQEHLDRGPEEDFKVVAAARGCFESLGFDKKKEVFHCARGPEGNQLLTDMGLRQEAMFKRMPAADAPDWDRPGLHGEAPQNHGPAVFINDVYLADNSRLLETICDRSTAELKSCLEAGIQR